MRYVSYSAGATDNSLRFVGFTFVPFGDFINESSWGAGLLGRRLVALAHAAWLIVTANDLVEHQVSIKALPISAVILSVSGMLALGMGIGV